MATIKVFPQQNNIIVGQSFKHPDGATKPSNPKIINAGKHFSITSPNVQQSIGSFSDILTVSAELLAQSFDQKDPIAFIGLINTTTDLSFLINWLKSRPELIEWLKEVYESQEVNMPDELVQYLIEGGEC